MKNHAMNRRSFLTGFAATGALAAAGAALAGCAPSTSSSDAKGGSGEQ